MATAGEGIASWATVEDGITAEPGALYITDAQATGDQYAAEGEPVKTAVLHIPLERMHTLAERVPVQIIAQRTPRHHGLAPRMLPRREPAHRVAAVNPTMAATLTSKWARQHNAAGQTSSAAGILARKPARIDRFTESESQRNSSKMQRLNPRR